MIDRLYRQLAIVLVLSLVLALGGLGSAAAQAPAGSNRGPGEFAPGEVLVKFVPGTPGQAVADLHRQLGGQVKQTIAGIEVQVLGVPVGQEKARAALYAHNPNVQFAEVNGLYHVAWTPNDPSVGQQWQYENTGQTGGTADADIDAFEAWDSEKGDPGVVVAVLDTGVNHGHPDLAGKVVAWKNFTTSDTVEDRHGHGTHTAGSVAARTNNGTGVAGTCPDCSIMNLKVLGDDGSGSWLWIADGIRAAADGFAMPDGTIAPGAKVISLSLGGGASSTVEAAVNYAWSKGVVVVAAAGNNGSSALFYPAAYPNAIAVAATDNKDAKASFSNYGAAWVDIAAPGVSILSTTGTGYASWSGTSMATPHVAGVAGLVWSTGKYGSAADVRLAIEKSAEPIAGTGTYWANGRLNAAAAVGASVVPINQPPVAAFTFQCTDLICTFDGSGSSDADGDVASYAWAFGDGATAADATATHTYGSAGTRTATLTVADNLGATDASSQAVTVSAPPAAKLKVHVGALSGSFKDVKRPAKTWTATAKVTVVDASGKVVPNAVVAGTWTASGLATTTTVQTTTNASGIASTTTAPMPGNSGTAVFTVTGISRPDASLEHEATKDVNNPLKILNR